MKPTDVPHYWRVMRQRAKAQGRKIEVHPHSHGGMNTLSRGCLAGIGFCFISHIGEVQGCGYFDKVAGDVRKQTFAEVWRDSPLFNELRDFDGLKGKCGVCEYKKVCGGCRAARRRSRAPRPCSRRWPRRPARGSRRRPS